MSSLFAPATTTSGHPATGLGMATITIGCPERGCLLRNPVSSGLLLIGDGPAAATFFIAAFGGRRSVFMVESTMVTVTSVMVMMVGVGTTGTFSTIGR